MRTKREKTVIYENAENPDSGILCMPRMIPTHRKGHLEAGGKNMRVQIWPRTATDKGGCFCMPLKKNVPQPRNKDWKLVRCPECGAECWRNEQLAPVVEAQGAVGLCTLCALKKGTSV